MDTTEEPKMLLELNISNLILIEQCSIKFHQGFSVVTGETGAGKSVFLSALKLLSGSKATAKLVRQGQAKAKIEGIFTTTTKLKNILDNEEIDSHSEIIIEREIFNNGKARIRINGTLCTLKTLQAIGPHLVQLHGQSEQILLKDVGQHQALLDLFVPVPVSYTKTWQKLWEKKRELQSLMDSIGNLRQQADFIQFQYQELEKAKLIAGEEEDLIQKLTRIESSTQLAELKNQSLDNLVGFNDSLQIKLNGLKQILDDLNQIVPLGFEEYVKEIENQINILADQIEKIEVSLDISPKEIDSLNSRLSTLQKLQRKFKTDHQGLIDLFEQRHKEINILNNFSGEKALLERELDFIFKDLVKEAKFLNTQRISAAQKLDSGINQVLQDLGMQDATFRTQILFPESPKVDLASPTGLDIVEFYVTPNLGEGEGPLNKTLSGGELSRVMLAIKKVLAHRDHVPTLVFDEVDTGISGEVGHSIGACLKSLAKHHQIICISHLHQVACQGDSHYEVKKSSDDGRTFSFVKELSSLERPKEIARMLGGSKNKQALEHAENLLK